MDWQRRILLLQCALLILVAVSMICRSHGKAVPPSSTNSPDFQGKSRGVPVAAPPRKAFKHTSPVNNSHLKGHSPALRPGQHDGNIAHGPSPPPPQPPAGGRPDSPAFAPAVAPHNRKARNSVGKPAPATLNPFSPPSYLSGSVIASAPAAVPKSRQHHQTLPFHQVPFISSIQAPAPSHPLAIPSDPNQKSRHSPSISPSDSYTPEPRTASPPVWVLPPPPPILDCNALQCKEPLSNPLPGSPCVCVLPIKVGLRLSVTLYTLFPMVSEFAQEIAAGIYMKQSQVHIMGANVASEQPEKSIVLVDLVPLEEKFDNSSAFLAYEKFWHKQIVIDSSLFGDYDVLYVLYPGLPPSPPTAPANINFAYGTFGSSNNARAIKPLGVDVRRHKKIFRSSRIAVAVAVLSSFIVLSVCAAAAWLLLLKQRDYGCLQATNPRNMLHKFAKSTGTTHVVLGNRLSSSSASFSSSFATYTGSVKTFSLAEIETATGGFEDSRIIGEGGFGRVYQGTLEDGTRVAVKLLKRDDQQGECEFLAEVEMLSRLHHRNLVKLIGTCTEEHVRCVVYELIPNGSVESHLHGVDKGIVPLDWSARMKIALGAARGLSYLHEDSSPPVIHRDFKSSNILLEHDYTPKVSDLGLARAALNQGNGHISTRVVGTFGYVAPEYAMTGHLLVKSDVYSYGVVLLELLTGRKPVDMLQPPGQENLVSWARPLLTSLDCLETIVDPALGSEVPFDGVAKVAAIASMCVQPEVSHRPFMGEVVQALKLVCHECNENRGSGSCSQDESSIQDTAVRTSTKPGLLAPGIFDVSARFARVDSCLFQSHSTSGPLRGGKSIQFWEKLRSFSTGRMTENGIAL